MEFWQAKFDANRTRDRKVLQALLEEGWRVATIWECALRKPATVTAVCEKLVAWMTGTDSVIEVGEEDIGPS
jgi:DNA mismatch endonuclease (patch repair protein)